MSTRLWIVTGILIIVPAALVWMAGMHVLPLSLTGEHRRLAEVAGLRAGLTVAEIGAGSSSLASAVHALTGPGGHLYVTEIDPTRLSALRDKFDRAQNVTVVGATSAGTSLPDGCCDVVYMRNVLHHVRDWDTYAGEVARALREGGRVVVIDFAPGALWWHLGHDHGAEPARVEEAFTAAGLTPAARIDDWGGGMFLLRFDR